MKLVAIDPGEVHVGVAIWGVEYRRDLPGEPGFTVEFDTAMELTPEIATSFVRRLSAHSNHLVLVIERYRFRGVGHNTGSKGGTIACATEIEAAARSMLENSHIDVIFQEPGMKDLAARTPAYKAHVLEHGDVASPHARDAVKHGVHYIRFGKLGHIVERVYRDEVKA